MADVKITKPQAGERTTIQSAADARLEFAFSTADAVVEKSGNDLVFTFDDGSSLVLTDFYTAYTKETLPEFVVEGQTIAGAEFLAALGNDDLMPAAGPAAAQVPAGGRFHEYGEASLMNSFDGLDRLGGLDNTQNAGNVAGTAFAATVDTGALADGSGVTGGAGGTGGGSGGDIGGGTGGGSGGDIGGGTGGGSGGGTGGGSGGDIGGGTGGGSGGGTGGGTGGGSGGDIGGGTGGGSGGDIGGGTGGGSGGDIGGGTGGGSGGDIGGGTGGGTGGGSGGGTGGGTGGTGNVLKAHDDTVGLEAGSTLDSGYNVLTGTGNGVLVSGGADQLGAGGATVVGIQIGNGTVLPVSAGHAMEIQGEYGKLTIHADGSYTYARDAIGSNGYKALPPEGHDTFTYTIKDAGGDTSSANLNIFLGDHTLHVKEAGESSIDGGLTTELVDGKLHDDYALTLPKDITISNVQLNGNTAAIAEAIAGGGYTLTTDYGVFTVNSNGKYSFDLADNSFVNSMAEGATVNQTYTMTLSNGTTVELHVAIEGTNDRATSVESNELTFSESNLANGTVPDADKTTQEGSIKITAASGVDELTVTIGGNPHTIMVGGAFTAGQVIATDDGNLTFTNYNAATGQLSYSYALTNSVNATDGVKHDFTVTVVEKNGQTSTGSIIINVTDDAPIAHDDTVGLEAGSTLGSDYNVLTGTHNIKLDSDASDKLGADGATVVGIQIGNGTVLPVSAGHAMEIQGEYGKLTINADGSYTYARDTIGSVGYKALPPNGHDTFTYTIKDADGDTSSAKLNIFLGDHTLHVKEAGEMINTNGSSINLVEPSAQHAEYALTLPKDITISGVQLNGNTVSAVATAGGGYTLTTNYGVFTVNSDGKYSFVLADNSFVASIAEGVTVNQTYTLTLSNGVTVDLPVSIEGTNDILNGTNDSDLLVGSAGTETLLGGDGNDILVGDGNDSFADDGQGSLAVDTLHSQLSSLSTDNLDAFASTLESTSDGNDTLWGDTGDDILFGLGGDDALYGGEGKDILVGGSGNDYLDGGKGADKLLGGSGNDVIQFDAADILVDGGTGTDFLLGDSDSMEDMLAGLKSGQITGVEVLVAGNTSVNLTDLAAIQESLGLSVNDAGKVDMSGYTAGAIHNVNGQTFVEYHATGDSEADKLTILVAQASISQGG